MTALWNSLTGGGASSREVVSEHFLATFDLLLLDSTSKLWRSRVGGCGALSELIVGRTWNDLGGGEAVLSDEEDGETKFVTAGVRLIRLWKVTVRAYDDVRGAVRDSAATLGRAVRSLTVRLCEPQAIEAPTGMKRGRDGQREHERVAMASSATALRWLMKYGLGQQCPEAAGLCISTLVEVVGSAHPVMLCPILPDLLRSLLLAISGLEPAALNFLQLKVEDGEGLERLRLRLAQSGPIATAVTKCLELIPATTIEAQRAVVSQLDTALRSSSGFATRAAIADSVSSLCATCPSAFKFAATSIGNPSVRLLRGLYYASERERTSASKEKMIHALGNLSGLCPGSSVRALAVRACKRYKFFTGNNEDQASKRAAASAIRAIAVRSSHHMRVGGDADVWRRRVLPVAFLGRHDEDAKVAALWDEVWNEAGAVRECTDPNRESFGSRMEEVLLPFLVSEAVVALNDVAWVRRRSGARAIKDLCQVGVLGPLESASLTCTDVVRDRYRSSASSDALRACVQVLSQPRLWSGKALILQTAIELASKWVDFAAEGRVGTNEMMHAQEETDSIEMSSKPIAVTATSESDLFSGDEWFILDLGDGTQSMEDEVPVPLETGTITSDSPLASAFEQDEMALESEDPPDEIRVTTHASILQASPLTFCGLAKLILRQAALQASSDARLSDEALPYRVAALQGLQNLMIALPFSPANDNLRSVVYNRSKDDLVSTIKNDDSPPVVVAAALGALSSMVWCGFGTDEPDALDELASLASLRKSQAWSVREASSICVVALVLNSHSPWLRQHKTMALLIQSASDALRDQKYWRVR
jgi:proteasome component ECM29